MHPTSRADLVRGWIVIAGVALIGGVTVLLTSAADEMMIPASWVLPVLEAAVLVVAASATVAGVLRGLRRGALADLLGAAAAATLAGGAVGWLGGSAGIAVPLAGSAAFLLAAAVAERMDPAMARGTRIGVAVALVAAAEAIVLLSLSPALESAPAGVSVSAGISAGGMGLVAAVLAVERPLAPVAGLVAVAGLALGFGAPGADAPHLLAMTALLGSQGIAVLALASRPPMPPAVAPLPAVVDHLDEAVLRFDGRLRLQDWNAAASRLLGLDTGSVGARIEDLLGVPVGRLPTANVSTTRVSAIGGLEIDLHAAADGVTAVIRDQSPASDGSERLGRELRATIEELLQARRTIDLQRTELERASTTDPLTGVLSRAAILDRLELEVAQARRYAHAVAVVLLDVDGFADINHRVGIEGGDAILREVALRIRLRVRRADALGRSGSDGFLAILPHTDESGAATFADALRHRAAQRPIRVGPHHVEVTISAGVAVMPAGEALDVDGLLARAEEALETARRAGGDRIALDRLHGLARLDGPRSATADSERPTAQDSGS